MKKWIGLGVAALAAAAGYFFWSASRFGAERIPYEVRLTDGRFELRDYRAVPVARASMKRASDDETFGALFRFITGGNARSEKIAMTTPVFIDGPGGAQSEMSFGMPAATQRRGIPEPDRDGIEISTRPAARIAALRFSGRTREAAERKAIDELRAWMQARNLEAEGESIIAYYDAPFIPGFLRRNEAMLRVRR